MEKKTALKGNRDLLLEKPIPEILKNEIKTPYKAFEKMFPQSLISLIQMLTPFSMGMKS